MPDKVKALPRAAQEWEHIAPMLDRMRVLSEADYLALAQLCLDVAMLDEVHESIQKTGLLVKTGKDGHMIRKNPLVELRMQLEIGIHRWLCEFGMTPSSRTKLHARPASASDTDVWNTF
jgi:P27 family predicted phage terminase small subunit